MAFFKKNKKILLTLLGLVIIAGILIINKEFSWQKIINLNPLYFALTILVYYLHDLIAATRWGMIVNYLEKRKALAWRKYLFYFSLGCLVGSFSFQELSNFGTRTGSLVAEKLSLLKSTNSYLIEKTLTLIIFFSFLWIGVLYFLKIISSELTLPLIVISFLIFYLLVANKKINFTKLIFLINKLLVKAIKFLPILKKQINIAQFEEKNKEIILSIKEIKKLYLLSFLKFLFYVIFIFCVFQTFNIEINFLSIFLAMPIINLGMLFALTPGALGIFETGWFIILKILAMSATEISAFIIGFRIVSYLTLSFNALVNYLIYLTVNKDE